MCNCDNKQVRKAYLIFQNYRNQAKNNNNFKQINNNSFIKILCILFKFIKLITLPI